MDNTQPSKEDNGDDNKKTEWDKSEHVPEKPLHNNPEPRSSLFSLDNIYSGLNSFVNYLNEMADRADQIRAHLGDPDASEGSSLPRRRYSPGNNNTVRSSDSSRRAGSYRNPGFSERYSTRIRKQEATSSPPVPIPASVREPLVDIFDETTEGVISLVAELPGIDERAIKIEVEGDILWLRATGSNLVLEKECLLPAIVNPEPISRRFHNGMLELHFRRYKQEK